MSDAVIKSVRRSSSRSVSQNTPSTKTRKSISKSARPAPIVKRTSAEKAPVQKAVKSKTTGTTSGSKAVKSAKDKRTPQSKQQKVRTTKTKSKVAAPKTSNSKKKLTPKQTKPETKNFGKADVSSEQRQQTSHMVAAIRAFEFDHKSLNRSIIAEVLILI